MPEPNKRLFGAATGMLHGSGRGRIPAYLFSGYQHAECRSIYHKTFADAHETEHPPILHLETEMDLFNNGIGTNIGTDYPDANIHSMANIVQLNIIMVDCKYLDPVDHAASPAYDDCYDPVTSPHCLNGILSTTVIKWTNQ